MDRKVRVLKANFRELERVIQSWLEANGQAVIEHFTVTKGEGEIFCVTIVYHEVPEAIPVH